MIPDGKIKPNHALGPFAPGTRNHSRRKLMRKGPNVPTDRAESTFREGAESRTTHRSWRALQGVGEAWNSSRREMSSDVKNLVT